MVLNFHRDDPCMLKSEEDSQFRTPCWPRDWIPDDVPNLRILGINYTSNISMWTTLCPLEGVRYFPQITTLTQNSFLKLLINLFVMIGVP